MRTAAIGIGSNSLRMLIADIQHGKMQRIGRYREGLRVFAALDEAGNITDAMIRQACMSVSIFQQEAIQKGAEAISLFATSAVRDAANQNAFAKALYEETGLELDICSGDMEASLSFWGACGEGNCGMIDIGGGSTEIVVGNTGNVEYAASLQMGAVRLYRMHSIQTIDDAEKAVNLARDLILPVREKYLDGVKREWIGVGGTFTAGAAVVQNVPWQNRDNIHGFVLTHEAVEKTLYELAPMTLEDRLKLGCIQPQRADIVVHGVAILLACMRSLDLNQITVSEYGNLEGYLKQKYIFSKRFE